MRFFTVFPDDWLSQTIDLTTEESGALWYLTCFFMVKDGRVPDDDRLLARITKLSTRRWRTTRTRLLEGGFIEVRDGVIYSAGWEERLEKDGRFARSQADKAKKKWAKNNDNTLKKRGIDPAPADASLALTPNTATSREKAPVENERSDREYAFAGTVIRLTENDLDQWRRIYHAVPDIEAELRSIDAWCARNWPDGNRKACSSKSPSV